MKISAYSSGLVWEHKLCFLAKSGLNHPSVLTCGLECINLPSFFSINFPRRLRFGICFVPVNTGRSKQLSKLYLKGKNSASYSAIVGARASLNDGFVGSTTVSDFGCSTLQYAEIGNVIIPFGVSTFFLTFLGITFLLMVRFKTGSFLVNTIFRRS